MSIPDYYILHQRSMSHPNITIEGITGLEPDGVWWNPSELFDLPDGGTHHPHTRLTTSRTTTDDHHR